MAMVTALPPFAARPVTALRAFGTFGTLMAAGPPDLFEFLRLRCEGLSKTGFGYCHWRSLGHNRLRWLRGHIRRRLRTYRGDASRLYRIDRFCIARYRFERLVASVRETLNDAIAKGGSTLRDYVDSAGEPGYFQLHYFVYGRTGQPCRVCGTAIRSTRLGGRATTYCGACQR